VAALEVGVLGGLVVRRDGAPVDLGPPKQRAVLAVLALEADRVVSDERLVELLWGEDHPKASSLRPYVSNLRRVLEPDRRPRDLARILVTQEPGYRLAVDPLVVDAHRFSALAVEARQALMGDDPGAALEKADAALALWSGPLLPELAGELWVLDAATRLEDVRATTLEVVADARLRLGDHAGAVDAVEAVVAAHPLRERAASLLALGLYRAGRQADALRTVADARAALAEVAGLDPGPELRALEADLLAQDPGLDWVARPDGPAGALLAPPAVATDLAASSPSLSGAPPTLDGAAAPAGPVPAPGQSPSGPSPVDPLIAHGDRVPVLGRDRELDLLLRALDAAVAGRGSAAAVIGEPGIGKTRLVEEVADVARGRGVVVAWARCPESGAMPSYWPSQQLGEQLRRQGVHDASLVAPPPGIDRAAADAARFAIDRAVVSILQSIAQPIVLVVDDLQWADPDSLRLLEHIAADLVHAPVLAIVTTRPLEEDAPEALVGCLGEIARAGGLHLALSGLDRSAVAEWLALASDVDVPDEVVEVLHDRTAGNPLFLHELVELLGSEGRLTDADGPGAGVIPPGVQFVVRRRVSRLPGPTQRLLSVASVVGRSFDLATVAEVAGSEPLTVLDLLEPAVASGLVEADRTGFRFSHALVADALAAEVNPARSAQIHAATARAIHERSGKAVEAAAVVAHHALAGAMAGTAELAVETSRRAARFAASRLAHEDAAGHWDRVAQALEVARPHDLVARAEAHLEAGAARLWVDLIDSGKASVLRAIALAEEAGDLALVARAAAQLATPSIWPQQAYGQTDLEIRATLERVLDLLPEGWVAERALTQGALTLALAYNSDLELRSRVSAGAVAEAERSGDPDVLARVLVNHAYTVWRASAAAEHRAVADRVIELADQHDLHPALAVVGRFHRVLGLLEDADLDGAQDLIDATWAVIDRAGGLNRAQLQWTQSGLALARGRYAEAAELGHAAHEVYRRTRVHQADLIAMVCTLAVAYDTGGIEELLEQLVVIGGEAGGFERGWTEVMALVTLEVGDPDAREAAQQLVSSIVDVVAVPDDWTWLWVLTVAAHVRADLGMVEDCARLVDLLEPHRGRWVISGTGSASFGLVDLALARCLAALGRTDEARAAFADAVTGHDRIRTPAWLARSLGHQARFLAGTGDPADAEAAEAARDRARTLADRHGLPYVLRRLS
jgi:DNA-binding SARP family transcriptional activator/tetratricopeptide (TPR) repeat protein